MIFSSSQRRLYIINIGDQRHRVDRDTYKAFRERELERLKIAEQNSRRWMWPRMRVCPLCDSSRVFVQRTRSHRHVPKCASCGNRLGWFQTEAEALSAWNRRATQAARARGDG